MWHEIECYLLILILESPLAKSKVKTKQQTGSSVVRDILYRNRLNSTELPKEDTTNLVNCFLGSKDNQDR